MKIDISVIIVSYRSKSSLLHLLDSLKASSKKLILEVIVVNNKPDEDLGFLKKHQLRPNLDLWTNNLGFSKGVNLALKKAKGEYIFLVNPDCQVVADSLFKLYQFANKHPELGAVVPRLLNKNGTPQGSAFKFPNITNAIKKYFLGHKNSFGKYLPQKHVQTLEVAVMAAMLIPMAVFKQIGTLDERFFLYYEDVEFCKRLYSYNLPLYYYPLAKVKHDHGASGGFTEHLSSPLLKSSIIYYGPIYSKALNLVLWLGHKWQVIIKGKKYKD